MHKRLKTLAYILFFAVPALAGAQFAPDPPLRLGRRLHGGAHLRALGDLAGRHVAIVGDLTHSRVFRSNIQCLTRLGARVTVGAFAVMAPRY